MPRHFVRIDKRELIEKILIAAKKWDALDEYYDKSDEDYRRGSDGDKEVGPLTCVDLYNWKTLTPWIKKDLEKVNFDMENVFLGKSYVFNMGHRDSETGKWVGGGYTDKLSADKLNAIKGLVTLDNGLTFLGLVAGGDWEFPVFFMIYWDGKKLRGYIPTKGNPWNTDTKMAYGNSYKDDYADGKNLIKRYPSRFADMTPEECNESFDSVDFETDKIIEDVVARITEK